MSGKLKTFRLALAALFAMFAFGVSAQTVKGTVKDANGEPVIGATVQEQGTKNVAVTDLDGNYTLKLSGGQQLQFSYIGMKAQSVDAKGKSVVNVTLEDEATALDDLVVIGYGTVKKRDLTGAVTSVSAEDIGQIPVTSPPQRVRPTPTSKSASAEAAHCRRTTPLCTSSTASPLRASATSPRRKSRASTCSRTLRQPPSTVHAVRTVSSS